MELKNTVEVLYLALMERWESTAPKEKHLGELDGRPVRNTQAERLAYIIIKIAAGDIDRVFTALSMSSRRKDEKSNISKDSSLMLMPTALMNGWFLEGNISLLQKQDIVQGFTKVGISPALVACIDDFVEGKSIKQYYPSKDETLRMLDNMHKSNTIDDEDYEELVRFYSET